VTRCVGRNLVNFCTTVTVSELTHRWVEFSCQRVYPSATWHIGNLTCYRVWYVVLLLGGHYWNDSVILASSAWHGHMKTHISRMVSSCFGRTAADLQHSLVSVPAGSTVAAGLTGINTPRLQHWMPLLGSYVQHGCQTTSHCCYIQHGSPTTSHRCSVTFIGYEYHSGLSSNLLCSSSTACKAWLHHTLHTNCAMWQT